MNEERQPAFDPAAVSVAEQRTIGLAQHTVLISRDGSWIRASRTRPLSIKGRRQAHPGAVLVFQ